MSPTLADGGRVLTDLWVSGTRGHLTHAARSPVVHALGRVELAVDGLRDGEAVDEVLADLAPAAGELTEALEVVGILLAAAGVVTGDGATGPGVVVDQGARGADEGQVPGDAGWSAAGLGDPVARAVEVATASRVEGDGSRWRVEVDEGGGRLRGLTDVTVVVPDPREVARADLATLCGDLLARWELTGCHLLVADSAPQALEPAPVRDPVPRGAPTTVPVHDPELARRRIARSLREVSAPWAVRVALAVARLRVAGVTLEGRPAPD